jgi:hypothetical protein
MTTFAQSLELTDNLSFTSNGMVTNSTSKNAVLDLFFIIGASRGKNITEQFKKAFAENPVLAIKTVFWARDVRGGAGERSTFRNLMLALEEKDSDLVIRLLPLIPEYGRFDDLWVFKTQKVRSQAAKVHVNAIRAGNGLAGKWADRQGKNAGELRKELNLTPKQYRKLIVNLTNVVEQKMCAQDWTNINYEHVPSVAAARYQKAFTRHDPVGYTEYKAAAISGTAKINAGAVYPYDVLKSMGHGDPTVAMAQWNTLPNFLGEDFILPVIDTSGSMTCPVGGNKNLRCIDIAISLGLYLADKQTGPFKDMVLNFNTDSKIHKLTGNIIEKCSAITKLPWGGTTNLQSAFEEILKVAKAGNVPQEQMPKYLLVISDMGFDSGTREYFMKKPFKIPTEMFKNAGYNTPAIIWWNVNHRAGGYGGDNNYPVTQHENGTALISGFSPSIVKSILAAKTITPLDIMLETINNPRYNAIEAAIS